MLFRYYNPHIPNIDAISGALFTLRIQYDYTQTQCDDGASHGIDIWLMEITTFSGVRGVLPPQSTSLSLSIGDRLRQRILKSLFRLKYLANAVLNSRFIR